MIPELGSLDRDRLLKGAEETDFVWGLRGGAGVPDGDEGPAEGVRRRKDEFDMLLHFVP